MLFDKIMHQNLSLMGFQRPRSFGELDQMSHVSCLSTFSKGFSSETTETISFEFHLQFSSKQEKKIFFFHPGHMSKMAAMAIYVKNVKKIHLKNHWADCLETWYVAFGTLVL